MPPRLIYRIRHIGFIGVFFGNLHGTLNHLLLKVDR
jgi:hypothetical protein